MRLITLVLLANLCVGVSAQPNVTLEINDPAPSTFKARFETSAGDFTATFHRDWSPAAVDRVYHLIRTGFFDSVIIFRVQPDYVVQFGISPDSALNPFWNNRPVPDEPVKQTNAYGTIAFARDTAETRTTQLFINVKDNPKLDTIDFNGIRGFPPIGKIDSGLAVVHQFYDAYGFEPAEKQDSVLMYGNKWLRDNYPGLDMIYSVRLIE